MQRKLKKVHLLTKSAILINNLYPSFKPPLTNNNIRSVVSRVMAGEDCGFNEIIVNFVSKSEIKKINKKFLDHDYFTDIITFPYNSNKKSIEGDLFISPETVKENGAIYNSGFKLELKRVIIHGCLHLTGYKDRTKKEKELIREKENFYLSN